MNTRNEGWWLPAEARNWHYFRNGKSLCGRWAPFRGNFPDYSDAEPTNCKVCRKKREREVAVKKGT